MKEVILHHCFDNGLTLVAQPMPWLESAAFSMAVPSGCRFDPVEKLGLANFVCEMVQRGSGELDSRRWVEQLDMLGVDYSSSVSLYNTNFGGAMQAAQLPEALGVYADVLRTPHFSADQLEDARMVCYQEIAALGDDLAQRALQQLKENVYGAIDGRSSEGTLETVGAISLDDLKAYFNSFYRPNGMILACAGKLDFESLVQQVGELFGDWQPRPTPDVPHAVPQHGYQHIEYESEQTHIAIAYPGIPYSHEDYYLGRAAVGVLSGGMSSRLFYEVREKRGLCYTVFASSHTLLDRGSVLCYSGTTNERAQETLDVILEQLIRLADGVTEDELSRLKVQMRSGMVMQQESCRSRASSIAGDWFHLGRVRSLEEIEAIIKSLSVESVNDYLRQHPPRDFDLVTLGPEPLKFAHGVSTASTE